MHRQHELAKADPVFTVNVTEWIRHYFQKAQRENGGMELFNEEWLENVDKNVLADFAKVIVI